jgi:diaminopimelate epimerase
VTGATSRGTFSRRMPVEFAKYEGLGNDFIVVDADSESAISPEQAARLCDRRFGVGADGVILVLPPRTEGAGARMRVLNADGSVPEMCGNGLRCAALHVARGGATPASSTSSSTRTRARGRAVCAAMTAATAPTSRSTWARCARWVGGRWRLVERCSTWRWRTRAIRTRSSSRSRRAARLAAVGPAVEKHPTFPRGTNVELARVEGSRIEVAVWERGVGPTLACGTGACAVAVVARAEGRVPDGPVTVRLPGGELQVEHGPSGRTRMRGPARLVFTGWLP